MHITSIDLERVSGDQHSLSDYSHLPLLAGHLHEGFIVFHWNDIHAWFFPWWGFTNGRHFVSLPLADRHQILHSRCKECPEILSLQSTSIGFLAFFFLVYFNFDKNTWINPNLENLKAFRPGYHFFRLWNIRQPQAKSGGPSGVLSPAWFSSTHLKRGSYFLQVFVELNFAWKRSPLLL